MKFIDMITLYMSVIEAHEVGSHITPARKITARHTEPYDHRDGDEAVFQAHEDWENYDWGKKMTLTKVTPMLPTGWQHPESLNEAAQHPVARILACFIKHPMRARAVAKDISLFDTTFHSNEWRELVLRYQIELEGDNDE